MDRPPALAKDGVFSGGLGFDIAYQGVLITVITLISYLIGHCMEVGYFEMPRGVSPDGMTMAFLTMSMCRDFPQLQHAVPAPQRVHASGATTGSSGPLCWAPWS